MKLACFLILLLFVQQDDVIRTETDVTNLPFTAMDKERRFITTLRAEDLRVLEDGVPQQLFTFQRETDRPLAITFLIDISRSQEFTLPDEKAAARSFIEKVIQSNKDQVAIVPFTGLAYLEQPITRDILSVFRVLERIVAAGRDDEMRGIGGYGLELRLHVCDHRAIDRAERGGRARRQCFTQLDDHVRPCADIGLIVEDRVAEQHDMRHGRSPPRVMAGEPNARARCA